MGVGSLGAALSAAAMPIVGAAGANQQGINAGNQQNTANLMDQVKLYQSIAAQQLAKQEAASKIGLEGAQTTEATARANSLTNPQAKPREAYTVPGVGLGHYDLNNKFVIDQPEAAKGEKLGPGENEYNADGSVKIKGPAPTQNFSPVVTTGAGGAQVVTPFNTKSGAVLPSVANAKAGGAGGGGQGAQTSIADLIAKDKAMTQLEPTLVANKSLTPLKEGEAAAGQGASFQAAHGATNPLSALGVTAGQMLGKNLGDNDPNSQRYIELGTNFGDEANNAFKGRSNEASAARKIALSRIQAQNAANPGIVQDTQEKRRNVIGMAILSHPEQRAALDPATVQYYIGSLSPQEIQEAQSAAAANGNAPAAPSAPSAAGSFSFGGKTYKVP